MNPDTQINKNENKESEPKTEVLTKEELEDLIYKGKSLPQDSRFLKPEKGGVFHYFDISRLVSVWSDERELFFPIVKVDNKILGLGELEKNPRSKEKLIYWIMSLNVDPAEQGKGYGTKLAKEIFRFAKEKGASLDVSSYSKDGWKKLEPLMRRFSEEYQVELIDNKGKMF